MRQILQIEYSSNKLIKFGQKTQFGKTFTLSINFPYYKFFGQDLKEFGKKWQSNTKFFIFYTRFL